jgi:hypothetical protein
MTQNITSRGLVLSSFEQHNNELWRARTFSRSTPSPPPPPTHPMFTAESDKPAPRTARACLPGSLLQRLTSPLPLVCLPSQPRTPAEPLVNSLSWSSHRAILNNSCIGASLDNRSLFSGTCDQQQCFGSAFIKCGSGSRL